MGFRSGKFLFMATCNKVDSEEQGAPPQNPSTMGFNLAEILDIPAIQTMMDDFFALMEVGMAIVDLRGNVLVATGWQDICTKFHRVHPETNRYCVESDTVLSGNVEPGRFKLYRCKNNLWDMATPIVVDGRHLGNLFLGQFFFDDEIPDVELFRTQARTHGFDETAYLAALDRVPRWSRKKVERTMSFYAQFARMISGMGCRNLQLSQALAEQQRTEKQLLESHVLLSLFMRHSPIHAFIKEVTATESRVLMASDNFQDMIGISGSQMTGKTMAELFPPEFAAKISTDDWSVVEHGEVLKLDEELNGRSYVTYKFPIVRDGKTLLAGYTIDVTDRKRTEEALRRANRALQTIGRCNQLLVSSPNEPALLDGICRLLVEQGGYCMAWVGFAEPGEGKLVRPVAQAGFEAGYLDAIRISWADNERGHGPTGTAIRTGQPSIVRDLSSDPVFDPWRQAAVQRGYASSIALPLRDGDRCFGALSLYAREPDAFDSEEVELLAKLADDLAYGIGAWRQRARQKQAEEHLRFHAQLLDSVRESVVASDLEGRILYWGRGAEALYGYSSAEVMGQPYRNFAGAVDPPDETAFRRALLAQGSWEGEHLQKRKNGETFWTSTLVSVVMDDQGRPAGFIGIDQDVTARKLAEEALRTSEERYRSILNASPDGIAIVDAEGRALLVSPQAAAMFGVDPNEDMRGRRVADFIAPEDRERALANVALTFQGRLNGPIEYRARRADGRTFDMEVNAERIRAAPGQPPQMVAVVRDVTDRKQRETYREMGREILRILNEPGNPRESLPQVLAAVKTRTGLDAVGIRLQVEDDFPFVAQQGLSPEFLQAENSLVEPAPDGGTRRACICGLVLSGKVDPALPGGTKGGSFWTNDAGALQDFPAPADSRPHPCSGCLRQGYASVALVPIRVQDRIVGLIQLNDRRQGCFTRDALEILESIASQIGTALRRKQAEEEVRASQQITEGIINTIPLRVFWKDKNLVYLGSNESFARDAGCTAPKDLVGKDDFQLGWRKQAERYRADDRQVIDSGQPKLFIEEPQTTPSGKTIVLLTNKIPLRNSQGEITGVLGTYMDITEHKKAEEALRSSAERFQDIAANIPGAIYQLQTGRTGALEVPYMSSGCEALFERPVPDLDFTGLLFDHMHIGDRALFRHSIDSAAGKMEHWSLEFRIETPGGKTKWMRGSANPRRLPNGTILWNGVLLDITELKAAEQSLREKQAFQGLLMDTIPIPVFYKDRQGRYLGFNQAFATLQGISKEQLVGKSVFDVAPPELAKIYHAKDLELFEHPGTQIYDSRLQDAQGGMHDVVFHKAAIADEQGRVTGLIGIIHDVTDRKRTEEQMARQLDELRRWYSATLGREDRIAELKREINALSIRYGQPPPYASVPEAERKAAP